ncbi:MAG: pilus assembly protein TadE [Sphingomonadales bacterium]|nr:pilus assembly protein TadE [Sphingomonadales bacterium]
MPVRLRRSLAALAACRSGNSLTEFALMLPLLLTAGMYGLEMTWMHNAAMQVSQTAIAVADNAARMEQTSNTGTAPTVTESDINAVLTGGKIESNGLDITGRGRIILSSLEVDGSNNQYIHWQRCTGGLTNASRYGAQGTVVTNMGSGSSRITATTGSAVMFVEVYYRYKPLFGTMFVQPMLFHQEAAFIIRDDRNLSSTSGTISSGC